LSSINNNFYTESNMKPTNLFLLAFTFVFANAIPDDWKKDIEEKNALFALSDDDPNISGALLGNGYFSSDIKGVRSDSYYISGYTLYVI
jgi:hypothetical protein